MLNHSKSTTKIDARAFTPGLAYWNQRMAVARARDRIIALSAAVNHPSDLSLYQIAQLFASVLEFAPDLVLELGRGSGNSTCAFTEAANKLPDPCRVLSLCTSSTWREVTATNLHRIIPESWFTPLDAVECDILQFDFQQALTAAKRVLVFWDAHGFDIAECVLAGILPAIADRRHVVLMHDMSDTRYGARGQSDYRGGELWNGINTGNARLRLGIIDSAVAQSISVQDFAGRNRVTLDSADHSFDIEINQVPGRSAEMRGQLGDQLFSLEGHWFWFSLNERPGPYTFPQSRQSTGHDN